MRAFLAALLATVVIAVGAAIVLERFQQTAMTAYATTAVRLEAQP